MATCVKCGKSKLIGGFPHKCNACGAQYCDNCFNIIKYKEGRNWIGKCVKCDSLVK